MNNLYEIFDPKAIRTFNLDRVYLFGSLALGSGNDIDLIVISEDFQGVSGVKRIEMIKSISFYNQVDPICFTKVEFTRLTKQKSEFLSNDRPWKRGGFVYDFRPKSIFSFIIIV